MKRILIICLLGLIMTLANPSQSFAEETGLAVYPPLITVKTQAPINLKIPLTIQNTADSQEILHVSFLPFTQADSLIGIPQFVTDSYALDQFKKEQANRFTLYENDSPVGLLELGPHQQKNLSVHISLPKDDPERDYAFTILFLHDTINTNQNASETNGNLTYQQAGIGTNVLLAVGNDTQNDLTLSDFSTQHFFFTKAPITITALLKNTAVHFTQVTGHVTIKNLLTQDTTVIPLQSANVLSHTERYLISQDKAYQSLSKSINYQGWGNTIDWKPRFLFGIYQIQLSLNSDKAQDVLVKSIYVLGLPIRGLALLLLITISITLLNKRAEKVANGRNRPK